MFPWGRVALESDGSGHNGSFSTLQPPVIYSWPHGSKGLLPTRSRPTFPQFQFLFQCTSDSVSWDAASRFEGGPAYKQHKDTHFKILSQPPKPFSTTLQPLKITGLLCIYMHTCLHMYIRSPPVKCLDTYLWLNGFFFHFYDNLHCGLSLKAWKLWMYKKRCEGVKQLKQVIYFRWSHIK